MVTISKKDISLLFIMEEYAKLHEIEAVLNSFEKKYNTDFLSFQKLINKHEDFEQFEDYIAWKANIDYLIDVKQNIEDLKNGKFQISA